MENLIIEAIKNRSSVRAYTEEKVTKQQLDILIEAGLAAPSAMNLQPCRLVAVTNLELIKEIEKETVAFFQNNKEVAERLLSRNNKIFYDASTVILISIPEDMKSSMDAGIMVENIAVAAKGIGLDSVIIGLAGAAFNGEKGSYFKEKLGFEAGHNFAISIAVGHGKQPFAAHTIDYAKATIIS